MLSSDIRCAVIKYHINIKMNGIKIPQSTQLHGVLKIIRATFVIRIMQSAIAFILLHSKR